MPPFPSLGYSYNFTQISPSHFNIYTLLFEIRKINFKINKIITTQEKHNKTLINIIFAVVNKSEKHITDYI